MQKDRKYIVASSCGKYIVATFGGGHPLVMPTDEARAVADLYRQAAKEAFKIADFDRGDLENEIASRLSQAIEDAESFVGQSLARAMIDQALKGKIQ